MMVAVPLSYSQAWSEQYQSLRSELLHCRNTRHVKLNCFLVDHS